MPKALQSAQNRWLSLGAACRLLGVNQATLRTWADRGLVRAYRTPGGHRRFSRDDLHVIVESPPSTQNGKSEPGLGDLALQRIRRRLHGRAVEGQGWYERFDETSRGRMRLFGRRLLTLTTDYLDRRGRRPQLLEEARFLGQEYGGEMVRLSLSLEDAVRAFSFFRSSLLEGLQSALGTNVSSAEIYHAWQQVNLVTDQVLHSLVRSYQVSSTQRGTRARPRVANEAGS